MKIHFGEVVGGVVDCQARGQRFKFPSQLKCPSRFMHHLCIRKKLSYN